ncbi:Inositol-pentakisphosphate 2-kinase [Quillaja saponaria]|uniref:Inositol-pentakisphosphate 2-kinase n=1 Tax=Quillaja saponaria TaxID=32244 RepID=A0AAD7LYR6_QUISA|nr:Inositol-pentakisphosphate 2-kinase [Quillaja saponaria]
MEVILEQKDAADWVYRGEGAANLVLAYSGSSPAFIGKVMRIQKVPRNGSNCVRSPTALTAQERLLWGDIEELIASPNKEIAGELYVQHVMSPLLGSKYVDAGMRVLASREFLESVEKNIISKRPTWRVDAAKVDTLCSSVLLLSDHSLFHHGNLDGGPCICVEIKPKCGFLPNSRFISEGTAIKKKITRFRMHQATEVTSRRGNLIFGGLGGGATNTNCPIAEAFEDELKSTIGGNDGLRTESFLQLVSEALHKSGVLDRLLEVQKLDNVDIEGAIHAYYDLVNQKCMVCEELGKQEASKKFTSLHSVPLDESLKIVKDYLIAATAKDCSLMVSFTPREDGDSQSIYNNVYLESTNQNFDFKVYFIDLDLKALTKVEEYYDLDKRIVSCYSQMSEMDQGREKTTT